MTTLPDYAEALGRALKGIEPLGRTTSVELSAAGGRVLGEPIIADRDLPPFDRAQMDGYALRAEEVGRVKTFAVQATIHAGQPADLSVPSGHCVAIATGAPLPDDVDTVIPHEQSDRGDPVRFAVDSIQPGHSVHARGADARRGDTLVAPGTQRQARFPTSEEFDRLSVPLTGGAGTVVLMTGLLWHRAGDNHTDTPRIGVLGQYLAKFVKPMEDQVRGVRQEVIERAGPTLRALLGIDHPYPQVLDTARR